MTGFGKSVLQLSGKKIRVEVKSLNSKNLDLNIRMPQALREMELPLRNQVAVALERGKIELSIFVEQSADQMAGKINAPVISTYINQLKAILPHADETELLKMAVRMPESLKVEREELDIEEWNLIQNTINEALHNLKEFRIAEGVALEKEFLHRIANIMTFMNETAAYENERINTVRARIIGALDDLQASVDENRFEQEMIFYLEKYDITEEKVRLENHLNYFIETLAGQETNGRKLGFILQEMGREINTMGSKSNHAQMQKLVVQMKDELEKIKEQVLNVL
jgi:uncharacterized protein (TIGR00255 family)